MFYCFKKCVNSCNTLLEAEDNEDSEDLEDDNINVVSADDDINDLIENSSTQVKQQRGTLSLDNNKRNNEDESLDLSSSMDPLRINRPLISRQCQSIKDVKKEEEEEQQQQHHNMIGNNNNNTSTLPSNPITTTTTTTTTTNAGRIDTCTSLEGFEMNNNNNFLNNNNHHYLFGDSSKPTTSIHQLYRNYPIDCFASPLQPQCSAPSSSSFLQQTSASVSFYHPLTTTTTQNHDILGNGSFQMLPETFRYDRYQRQQQNIWNMCYVLFRYLFYGIVLLFALRSLCDIIIRARNQISVCIITSSSMGQFFLNILIFIGIISISMVFWDLILGPSICYVYTSIRTFVCTKKKEKEDDFSSSLSPALIENDNNILLGGSSSSSSNLLLRKQCIRADLLEVARIVKNEAKVDKADLATILLEEASTNRPHGIELEEAQWIQYFGKRQKPFLRMVKKVFPRRSKRIYSTSDNKRGDWWKQRLSLIEDPFLRVCIRTALGDDPNSETSLRLLDTIKALWENCNNHPLPDISTEWYPTRPLFIRAIDSTESVEFRILRLLRNMRAEPLQKIFGRGTIIDSTKIQNLYRQNPDIDLFKLPRGRLLFNQGHAVYPIETELFKGHILIRLKTNTNGGHPYFKNRKRLMQGVIQGTFKQTLSFDEVLTGQVWHGRWQNVPPAWILKMITKIISNVLPAVRTDFSGSEPYLLLPLITAFQVVNICNPTQKPPPVMTNIFLEEDVSLLGAPFIGNAAKDRSFRRSFFSKPENLKNRWFQPGLVYTLETYQHLFNIMEYKLHLPLMTLDLCKYINHQPIEINAFVERKYSLFGSTQNKKPLWGTEGDRQYLWRIQLCHEKLLCELE